MPVPTAASVPVSEVASTTVQKRKMPAGVMNNGVSLTRKAGAVVSSAHVTAVAGFLGNPLCEDAEGCGFQETDADATLKSTEHTMHPMASQAYTRKGKPVPIVLCRPKGAGKKAKLLFIVRARFSDTATKVYKAKMDSIRAATTDCITVTTAARPYNFHPWNTMSIWSLINALGRPCPFSNAVAVKEVQHECLPGNAEMFVVTVPPPPEDICDILRQLTHDIATPFATESAIRNHVNSWVGNMEGGDELYVELQLFSCEVSRSRSLLNHQTGNGVAMPTSAAKKPAATLYDKILSDKKERANMHAQGEEEEDFDDDHTDDAVAKKVLSEKVRVKKDAPHSSRQAQARASQEGPSTTDVSVGKAPCNDRHGSGAVKSGGEKRKAAGGEKKRENPKQMKTGADFVLTSVKVSRKERDEDGDEESNRSDQSSPSSQSSGGSASVKVSKKKKRAVEETHSDSEEELSDDSEDSEGGSEEESESEEEDSGSEEEASATSSDSEDDTRPKKKRRLKRADGSCAVPDSDGKDKGTTPSVLCHFKPQSGRSTNSPLPTHSNLDSEGCDAVKEMYEKKVRKTEQGRQPARDSRRLVAKQAGTMLSMVKNSVGVPLSMTQAISATCCDLQKRFEAYKGDSFATQDSYAIYQGLIGLNCAQNSIIDSSISESQRTADAEASRRISEACIGSFCDVQMGLVDLKKSLTAACGAVDVLMEAMKRIDVELVAAKGAIAPEA